MSLAEIFDSIVVDVENFFRGAGALVGVVKSYDSLPLNEEEPAAESSIEALEPFAQQAFLDLEQQFAAALAPIGWRAVRAETRRTGERQLWLWGIGRLYKALGRTGVVTDFKTVHGPHGKGVATDYDYFGGDDRAALATALASVAAVRPDMEWGGAWITLVDPRHWALRGY